MDDDSSAVIHLRVAAITKARWVRASRAAGMRLTDWIIEHVDRPANRITADPCPRCSSVVLTADGPGAWQCAQCGLAA